VNLLLLEYDTSEEYIEVLLPDMVDKTVEVAVFAQAIADTPVAAAADIPMVVAVADIPVVVAVAGKEEAVRASVSSDNQAAAVAEASPVIDVSDIPAVVTVIDI